MDPTYLNLPNLVTMSDPGWHLVALALMVSYGACFAFAGYFALSSFQLSQRYRLVAILSMVVMVSAGMSLFREYSMWQAAFEFVPGTGGDLGSYVPLTDGQSFSNVYRYGNWTITVPLLLTQLPIAMGLSRGEVHKRALRMSVAGIAMIWTGLVGQFGEVSDFGLLNLWGIISTLFFVWLLVEVFAVLKAGKAIAPPALKSWPHNLIFYMLLTWGLYPIAYALPQLGQTETVVIAQQYLFTAADLTTKLFYGIILARYCLRRSALEGHVPAIQALANVGEAPHLQVETATVENVVLDAT